MKNKYQLPNRDGLKNYLVKYKDGLYYFEPEHDWIAVRVIGGDELKGFDPSGGPFISVGYETDEVKVEELSRTEESVNYHILFRLVEKIKK